MNPALNPRPLVLMVSVACAPKVPPVVAPSMDFLSPMVTVPAATFTVGSAPGTTGRQPDEGQAEVVLSHDLLVMSTEVSRAAWIEIVGEDPSDPDLGADLELPVGNVSWFEAVAFANACSERAGLPVAYTSSEEGVVWDRNSPGFRLPTEAEWEWAARGGGDSTYAGGDDPLKVANLTGAEDGFRSVAPVGSLASNGYGLYDMSGNVEEWVWDWWERNRPGGTDPAGPELGRFRAYRGGAWNSPLFEGRVTHRKKAQAKIRRDFIGFRLVRTVPRAE